MSNKAVKTSLVLSVEHRSCWQIMVAKPQLCINAKSNRWADSWKEGTKAWGA